MDHAITVTTGLSFEEALQATRERLSDEGFGILTEIDLAATLKEKDLVIRATARKEAEMGKLIQRLSAECNQLSTEVQQKIESMPKTQENRSPLRIDATIWRMIGRMQEESQ